MYPTFFGLDVRFLKFVTMEFIATVFSFVFSFNILGAVHTDTYCRGDIVDIYFPIDQENLAYDSDCVYTKTPRSCIDCQILFVRRSKYDQFAKTYTDYGLPVPVPRRKDKNQLYKPYDGFTPQNKLKQIINVDSYN